MTPLSFSRGQMVREATLTEADLAEVAKCRRDHNRLGFAYQVGFVRLFSRFPAQQPLEICDELLNFVALQLGIDEARIADYAPWQHTASEHQERIREYLKLTVYGPQDSRSPGTLRLRGIVLAWSRPLRCSPGPASSSRSGASSSPPSRRCCGWSESRRSGPANTSLPSWPGAFRPAWSRPSTACWR